MDSQTITVRIPDRILEKIDRIAAAKYPQRNGKRPNRSQVILDALDALENLDEPTTGPTMQDMIKRIDRLERAIKERAASPIEKAAISPIEKTTTSQIGITNSELAQILGVHRGTVSHWKRGTRRTPENLGYKFDQCIDRWVKNPDSAPTEES